MSEVPTMRCPCCGQPAAFKCARCGASIMHPRVSSNPERTQRYCSSACRLAAYRDQRKEKSS